MNNQRNLLLLSLLFLFFSCSRPIAEFTYQAQKRTAPAKVQFENTSQKAESYEWDFGDGNISTEPTPNHQYMGSGNYVVKLKAIKGKKSTLVEKRLVIDAPKECLVLIETSFGTMTAILYNDTPLHRDNFIKLAEEGYYNDLLFHRVINGFMIQGGDPNSRNASKNARLGSGGPKYTVEAEFVDTLVHLKGALAAARAPDAVNPEKRSSGSQFYIVQGRMFNEQELSIIEGRGGFTYDKDLKESYLKNGGYPPLDRGYTVFGQVIKGLEVIDEIANVQTGMGDRPVEDVKMKITVIK